MSKTVILASSFDWTIAICSMKELLQCSVPLIATENIVISNSHSGHKVQGGGGGGEGGSRNRGWVINFQADEIVVT